MTLKLRNKSPSERLKTLYSILSDEDCKRLEDTHFDGLILADTFIENAVGYFCMPLGLAPGFIMNGKSYAAIPLAIEETSVVAGVSKSIKLINQQGEITAQTIGQNYIGQIHFSRLKNPTSFSQKILSKKDIFIDQANNGPCQTMAKRGGGMKDLSVHILERPDGHHAAVVHLSINTQNAMGANIINQTCEYLRPFLEMASEEIALMSILSNFNPQKQTQIDVCIKNLEPSLMEHICEASLMAQLDPYRAATHNKGVMNGMDAVCIATGNDWRALEAGVHAFAVQNGQYRGLSQWTREGNNLYGKLCVPINVGTVGGVTKGHHLAQVALQCLKVDNADELAQVIGAVGLIQNFTALRALVTEGIVKGHMHLHLTNLIQQTETLPQERDAVLKAVTTHLLEKKYITLSDVVAHMENVRNNQMSI